MAMSRNRDSSVTEEDVQCQPARLSGGHGEGDLSPVISRAERFEVK
jgi:hypothetical protein